MQLKTNSSTLWTPIAFAEGGSTLVSLGTILTMERNPGLIRPLKDFVAEHYILPSLAKRHPDADHEALLKQAQEKASLLIKGTAMVGVGFASHLPIQLALEGRLHGAGLRDAAYGKGIGLGISLGSILVLNKLAPSALPAVQNAIFPLVKPFLPKDDRGRDSRQAAEVAKLLILDIPSSIASGLINYNWARKLR